MADLIPIRNTNATPKSYLDMSRPTAMAASDAVYKKLEIINGDNARDVLDMAFGLRSVISKSKSVELDKVWENLEKELYNRKTLKTVSKTDEAKFQTAFGLFYNILNDIDSKADSTLDLMEFRTHFLEAQSHITRRVVPGLSGKDLRNVNRIMDTITNRLTKVTERFNTRVDEGDIAGPKI
jgi:hypothetical protein